MTVWVSGCSKCVLREAGRGAGPCACAVSATMCDAVASQGRMDLVRDVTAAVCTSVPRVSFCWKRARDGSFTAVKPCSSYVCHRGIIKSAYLRQLRRRNGRGAAWTVSPR